MDPGRPLDAGRTALVVDSSCDVPPERRPANWRVVPIPVIFGDRAFADGVDIDAAAFYERLARAGRLPTTAQPSPGVLEDVMRRALEDHDSAVVLPLSGRMSGTVERARAAAEAVDPARTLVLESGSVTVALGLIALRLQALLERGCTAGEAAAHVAALSAAHRAVFTLETLEFLLRGGRIGRAQAVAGSLLRVRPILQILDGEVAPHSRVRGAHRVLPAIERFVAENSRDDRPLRVAYGHSRRPEVVPELEALVAGVRPLAVTELVAEVGPTVGTHAGPGAYVVAFVHDPPAPHGGGDPS
ncbi:DegV family protein [Miltoncostaea marina]|uniref:DegV family protein n=1 Tax=Miltoncostaea marina TaxID=2843215 RepID=UPI001C3C5802|nr:DegV family protein [Miltoncostaea marina]